MLDAKPDYSANKQRYYFSCRKQWGADPSRCKYFRWITTVQVEVLKMKGELSM